MNNYQVEWVSIEIDTHCNIRCTMCPIGHDKVKQQGRIDIKTFGNIVRLCQGHTEKIALAVMGEPLLHPELPQMVRIVKSYGLNALVWTNGMLLTEDKARELLEAGMDKLFFSYEILNKALHEKIRVGANYEKVMQNLDNFLLLKEKLRPSCEVAIWNIIPDTKISLDFPLDIKEKYKHVELYASYAMDWHGEIEVEKTEIVHKVPSACNQIKNYLSVSYKGDFISCCNDFNHEYTLGNANEIDSLDEIWFGKKRKNLIDAMDRGNLDGINPCEKCSAPYVVKGVDRVLHKDKTSYDGVNASSTSKEINSRKKK